MTTKARRRPWPLSKQSGFCLTTNRTFGREEWRESQRNFCVGVSWERIGAYLFAGGRKTTRKSLGELTLSFIEGNYRDEVTQDDRLLLESLKDAIPKEPKDEEIEFFARWQERLNHPEVVRLYKSWQKRLFSKEVLGHNFLSTFSEGV